MIEISEGFEDIQLYDDAITKHTLELRAIHAKKNGLEFNLQAEEEDIRSQISKVGRKLEYPDNFFNFDYGLTINVTGENVDKGAQNDAYANIMEYIMKAPAIQANPYFRQYVENNGITPIRLTNQQVQQETQNMQGNNSQNGQQQPAQPQAGGNNQLQQANPLGQ